MGILCSCSVSQQVRGIPCPVSTVKSHSHLPADTVTVRGDPNSCHSCHTQGVPSARGDSIPAGWRAEEAPREETAEQEQAAVQGLVLGCGSSSPLHSGAGLLHTPFRLSLLVQKMEASPSREKGLSPLLVLWQW